MIYFVILLIIAYSFVLLLLKNIYMYKIKGVIIIVDVNVFFEILLSDVFPVG
jgi:hypothetical protein